MARIYFQKERDAVKVFELLSGRPQWPELYELFQRLPGEGIHINAEGYRAGSSLHELLKSGFHQFFIEDKLWGWLEKLIMERFYYQEQNEIQSILEIASAIIESREYAEAEEALNQVKGMFSEGLSVLFEGRSFSYDSFIQFRLKAVYDLLETVAVLAIDEYKLEQEYQSFLATLRDTLNRRPPQVESISLVHLDSFQFYTVSGKKLSQEELQAVIDRRVLLGSLVYIDASTLAPLLSLAPKQLKLYSDNPDHALVRAISRLFEERCTILPVRDFDQTRSMRKVRTLTRIEKNTP